MKKLIKKKQKDDEMLGFLGENMQIGQSEQVNYENEPYIFQSSRGKMGRKKKEKFVRHKSAPKRNKKERTTSPESRKKGSMVS